MKIFYIDNKIFVYQYDKLKKKNSIVNVAKRTFLNITTVVAQLNVASVDLIKRNHLMDFHAVSFHLLRIQSCTLNTK